MGSILRIWLILLLWIIPAWATDWYGPDQKWRKDPDGEFLDWKNQFFKKVHNPMTICEQRTIVSATLQEEFNDGLTKTAAWSENPFTQNIQEQLKKVPPKERAQIEKSLEDSLHLSMSEINKRDKLFNQIEIQKYRNILDQIYTEPKKPTILRAKQVYEDCQKRSS